jgi:ABC-type transporter MlaC component
MKRFSRLLIAFSLVLTSLSVAAQAPGYRYQPYAQYPNYQQQSPIELLQMAINVLQDYLKSGKFENPDEVVAFLDANFSQFFDFEQMARWAAGYHYARMNSAQRYIFQTNLKRMFFSAFARIISAYGDKQPRVEFLPPRRISYTEVLVTARIYPSDGGYPIRVDFRFAQGPLGWKIYDVGTNGSSAVAYYRSFFNNLIRTRGYGALLQQ